MHVGGKALPREEANAGVAKATGFRAAGPSYMAAQLKIWLPLLHRDKGRVFAGVKVGIDRGEFILPPRDGTERKLRFSRRCARGDPAPPH